tara:strand:+ start:14012 stop:14623 length:612 start_codon:yes stop_codon:yes gene_type:complete
MTFGFNQQPTPTNALSLGLPNSQQSMPMNNMYQQQQYQQGFQQMGTGMMGAMGLQQPTELAPPSDLEVMAALIQTSVPMDRWIAGPNMQVLVSLLYKISALATVDVLKNVTIAETEDGNLAFDFSGFENAPTADSVTMEANQLQNAATMTRDQAMQQQQAILNTVQQNLMSGALNAAMANPGMMESVGTGVGSLFRGALGMRT